MFRQVKFKWFYQLFISVYINKQDVTMQLTISTTLLSISFFLTFGLLTASSVYANTEKVSISIGQLEKSTTELDRNIILQKTQHSATSITSLTPAIGTERQLFIANKKTSKILNTKSKLAKTDNTSLTHDEYQFSIFDAQSTLLTDVDFDGYYQGFSVSFDADYLRYDDFDTTTVYAEMYLSKNGGPWLHYFTTEDFIIQSDDSNDDYEVVTTLLDGYSSDNYDVLIDLYEVGYTDIVATYSSDDSNALYALPLESANYDITQPDVIIVESYSEGYGGGSFFWLLLLPAIVILIRRFR